MLHWFEPIGAWFGVDETLIPLLLFLILVVLIISLIRG